MVASHHKKERVVGRTERAFPPDEFVTPYRGRCKGLAGIGRVTARWGRYYARWRRHDGKIVLGREHIIVVDDKSRRTLAAQRHPARWIGRCHDDGFVALNQGVIKDRQDDGLIGLARSKIQRAAFGSVVLAGGRRAVAGGVVHGK